MYHLSSDACSYCVGAGLFQAPVVDTVPTLPASSHYDLLGLPTWSQKQMIDKRDRELKRDYTKRRDNQALALIDEAYETLSDDQRRTVYDESLGLSAIRRSRFDLQPLGFMSASLDKSC